MIDPNLALAFSVHANKGVYAVLLGSGISRSAGIPTGWEIVEDLITQVAAMQGADPIPSPAVWYEATYGESPDYAKLLDTLAKSAAERQQVLRHYFEANATEREEGRKVPTNAHQAIAQLVAQGFIKVIVTTNFDRLMEEALEAQGIAPTVVATPDGIEGMFPLPHMECLVLKVHGDYRDARLKNTPDELATYDPRLNALLDRIFDEYGLIVCGWSATWDTALRAALERCATHRFSTYWLARTPPQGAGALLIQQRRASVIPTDADRGFATLAEHIAGLVELDRPHPLTAQLAAATVKRYLPEPQQRIRLHDLVHDATEELMARFSGLYPSARLVAPFSAEELAKRLSECEVLVETAQAMFIQGCLWSDAAQMPLWTAMLERIMNPPLSSAYQTAWGNLRRYPALLLMYSGGMAALSHDNYAAFAALLTQPLARDLNETSVAAVLALNVHLIVNPVHAKLLPGMKGRYTPLSEHLFAISHRSLRPLIADDDIYEDIFDRFEYLFALVHADMRRQKGQDIWGPIGSFGWRKRLKQHPMSIRDLVTQEAQQAGAGWGPLQAGLFRGSIEEFLSLQQDFDTWEQSLSGGW